jgi:hypothetical protein
MTPHSRAQRRRQNARQAARANVRATQNQPESLDEVAELSEPVIGETVALSPPPTRQARQVRRPVSRPAPEPVDHTQDYVHARRDLLRVVLWSAVLFAAMIALKFSGLI